MMAMDTLHLVILIMAMVRLVVPYFVIPCGVECDYLTAELRLACSGRSMTCIPKPCCIERTRIVDLSRNNLSSIPSRSFQSFPNLNSLDLKLNSIEYLSPRAFQGLRYLHALDIRDNKLATLQAGVFEGLLNLRSLTLSKNRISDIQPGTFRLLPNLKHLKLHHNLLQVVYPDTFAQLTELVSLDIDSNLIHTIYQGSFSALVNLESLSLVNNNIASLPEFLESLDELEHLHLKGNPLYCDCSLEFLRQWYVSQGDDSPLKKSGECSQPLRLAGRRLATLTAGQLCRVTDDISYSSYASDYEDSYIQQIGGGRPTTSTGANTQSTKASTSTAYITSLLYHSDASTAAPSTVTQSDGLEAEVEHPTIPMTEEERTVTEKNAENVAEDVTNSNHRARTISESYDNPGQSSNETTRFPTLLSSTTITHKPLTDPNEMTTAKSLLVSGKSLNNHTGESLSEKAASESVRTTFGYSSGTNNQKPTDSERVDADSSFRVSNVTPSQAASSWVTTKAQELTSENDKSQGLKGTHITTKTASAASVMDDTIIRKSVDVRSDKRPRTQDGASEHSHDMANPDIDFPDVYAPLKSPDSNMLTEYYEELLSEDSIHSGVVTEKSYAHDTTTTKEGSHGSQNVATTTTAYDDILEGGSTQTALLGEAVILSCPVKTIAPLMDPLANYDTKWLSPSGQWIEHHADPFTVTESGRLSISHVRINDHGIYQCVRAQSMGAPVVSSVQLHVSCPCQQIPEETHRNFTKKPKTTAPNSPTSMSTTVNGTIGELGVQGISDQNNNPSCSHMPIAVAVLITFQVTIALCVITFCAFLSWRSSRQSKPVRRPRPEAILERPRPLSGVNHYDRGEAAPSIARSRSDIPTIVYESTGDEKPEEAFENNSESDSALSSSGSQRNSAVGGTDVYINASQSSLRRDTETYADLDPNSRSRHDTYSSLHPQEQDDSE